jgi:hypothetical protein
MENLRNEILNKTREHKIPFEKKVSRTFYIPVTEEFDKIKSWYKDWFPLHDSLLEKFYTWLPSPAQLEEQQIKDSINTAWRNAMGVNTIRELTIKGYTPLDSSIQIIFLVDLSEKNGFARLDSVKKLLDEIIDEWASPTTIFFSCIAVLRNYDETTGNLLNALNIEKFFDWSRKNLHRLYAVDIQNLRGTFISGSSDMRFFIGQFLNYLTYKPIDTSLGGNFAEWISSVNPNDGKATAFSAISYVFPIDYVLEICLVRKGAEQMERALFSDPTPERIKLFVNSVKNKNGLNSHSVLCDHVFAEKDETKAEDPLRYIDETIKSNSPKSFMEEIELHLFTYKTIDSALPGMADRISTIYAEQASNVPLSFYFNVLEHTDKIFNEETGSAGILDAMYNELGEHIKNLAPEGNVPSNFGDINNLIDNLIKEKQNAPSGKAVISRLMILIILSGITAFEFLQNRNLTFTTTIISILFLAGLYLGYAWYTSKKRIEKLYLQIENVLARKWKVLKTTAQNKLVEIIKDQCLFYLKECTEQTKKVTNRFKEVVEFGKYDYDSPKPPDSAFWMNAVNIRTEALSFFNLISDSPKLKLLSVFKDHNSAELWNRLCFTGEKKLNEWEISLLEKAAIEQLPNAEGIINTSVCEVLDSDKNKFNNLKLLMSNYCEPFTSLNRLDVGDSEAILEIPDSGCKAIEESISEDISGQFRNIRNKNSGCNYRISFLSFAEGLNFNKIINSIKIQK